MTWLHRENRKLTARLKVGRIKERSACLEDIEYSAARSLRKDQVLELAQNRWLSPQQGVLITGPSGCGKSFLAQALAQHACRSGFSAQYLRLPTLLAQFAQARAQGTYERLLKRLAKQALIVIDDFGLAKMTELEKQDLLEAIEERYGSGASIVTSQLPVGDRHEYLGGGRIADAILDRLIHSAHRIELSSRESTQGAFILEASRTVCYITGYLRRFAPTLSAITGPSVRYGRNAHLIPSHAFKLYVSFMLNQHYDPTRVLPVHARSCDCFSAPFDLAFSRSVWIRSEIACDARGKLVNAGPTRSKSSMGLAARSSASMSAGELEHLSAPPWPALSRGRIMSDGAGSLLSMLGRSLRN